MASDDEYISGYDERQNCANTGSSLHFIILCDLSLILIPGITYSNNAQTNTTELLHQPVYNSFLKLTHYNDNKCVYGLVVPNLIDSLKLLPVYCSSRLFSGCLEV